MNFKETLGALLLVLGNFAEQSPEGGVVIPETGEFIDNKAMRDALEKLRDYVWPQLDSDSLVQIVLCTDCKYCKRQRKKSPGKAATTRLVCGLTGEQVTRMFYCGKGEARE